MNTIGAIFSGARPTLSTIGGKLLRSIFTVYEMPPFEKNFVFWSRLKPIVMVVDNKTTKQQQFGRNRGIPKTQRVLASTNNSEEIKAYLKPRGF